MTKVHPIKRYCDRIGISQAEFARTVGITPQWVSQLLKTSGTRVGGETAKTIVEKTGGEISYADLYSWEPPAPPKQRKGAA